jgi:hypothetical protein
MYIYLKKKLIGLLAEKFKISPKIKMAVNLEIMLKPPAWFMLEFIVLVL